MSYHKEAKTWGFTLEARAGEEWVIRKCGEEKKAGWCFSNRDGIYVGAWGWWQGPGEGSLCLTIALGSCFLRLVWYFCNMRNPSESLCMCLPQECDKKMLKFAAQQGQKCSRANLTLEQTSCNKLICAEWKWKENIVLFKAFGRVFSHLFTHSCDLHS